MAEPEEGVGSVLGARNDNVPDAAGAKSSAEKVGPFFGGFSC